MLARRLRVMADADGPHPRAATLRAGDRPLAGERTSEVDEQAVFYVALPGTLHLKLAATQNCNIDCNILVGSCIYVLC